MTISLHYQVAPSVITAGRIVPYKNLIIDDNMGEPREICNLGNGTAVSKEVLEKATDTIKTQLEVKPGRRHLDEVLASYIGNEREQQHNFQDLFQDVKKNEVCIARNMDGTPGETLALNTHKPWIRPILKFSPNSTTKIPYTQQVGIFDSIIKILGLNPLKAIITGTTRANNVGDKQHPMHEREIELQPWSLAV